MVEAAEFAAASGLVADERPGLALVGPVVRLQTVRFAEVSERAVAIALFPQMQRELEVGCAFGLVLGAFLGAINDFARAQRKPTLGTVGRPVADCIGVGVTVLTATKLCGKLRIRRFDLGSLGLDLGIAGLQELTQPVRVEVARTPTGFRRPDDHAILIDPDNVGDIDDTEQGIHLMGWVQQRRVVYARAGRPARFDELAGRFGVTHLK